MYNFHDEIAVNGFAVILRTDRSNSLSPIQIARSLNPSKVQVKKLVASSREVARPNTLSSDFGFDEFPIHTDFVTQPKPPRYLILHARMARRAKTILYNSQELIDLLGIEQISRSLFKVRSGYSYYFSSAYGQISGQNVFRINPTIMTPINREGQLIWDVIMGHKISPAATIDWALAESVIVDNWNMMHSRETIKLSDNPTSIRRISIWN